MFLAKRYLVIMYLFISTAGLSAQNLTGTWEGEMGTYQFLQLNIIQNGDKICGYTWDHLAVSQEDFCRAHFVGQFNKQTHKLSLAGNAFIENSGSHTLMQIKLSHKYVNDEEVLYYEPTLLEKFLAFQNQQPVETGIYLKKISNHPTEIIPGMSICFEEEKKYFFGDRKVRKDSADSVRLVWPPVNTATDSIALPGQVSNRKNSEQSHITVDVKTINLKVYDNAIMDGDTVSIYYNGRILLSRQELSEKAIEINLELDDKQTRHEIILFAHNLGSIPPNTALVVITAGEKRYELFASANLEENAVIVFDYRPK